MIVLKAMVCDFLDEVPCQSRVYLNVSAAILAVSTVPAVKMQGLNAAQMLSLDS
jgi:hypothetical protein